MPTEGSARGYPANQRQQPVVRITDDFVSFGNLAEWTHSAYADGDERVVCGGSWQDRPYRATSSYCLAYEPCQRVFNVGFRVVCAE